MNKRTHHYLHPLARTDNIVVQRLKDEMLIYDTETHKAYSLNKTSTLVWQNCDGKKGVAEIAAHLRDKLHEDVPDDLVLLALDGLKKQGLVSDVESEWFELNYFDRRDAVKHIGLSTLVTLPMIGMLVAPTSAQAGCSTGLCGSVGDPCQNVNDCRPTNEAPVNCNNGTNCPGGIKCCWCLHDVTPCTNVTP